MTRIPENHPRYHSLMSRERIVQGMRDGIVAEAGLIAHGRGEALDYLMGERTLPEALLAEKVAAMALMDAERPVISVNGNTAILAAREIVELAELTGSRIEVNLFHRTEERIRKITGLLLKAGAGEVLGSEPDARIPGLDSERGKCTSAGIGGADVILVPLEDGDRAQALKQMGKTVICIDLNPLSRTSRTSDISIADEVTRAFRNMIDFLRDREKDDARGMLKDKREPREARDDHGGKARETGEECRGEPRETKHGGKGEECQYDLLDFDNRKNLEAILARIADRLREAGS